MLKQPATPIAVPYSTEAEQCLLGALMLDNDRWDDINLLLKTQDFFLAAHRHVFKAMSGLSSESLPIDLITLSEKLEHEGKLDHCGGFAYLAELSKNTPSAANILGYAGIVIEKSRLRALQIIGNSLIADIQANRLNSQKVAEHAENALFQLNEQGASANNCESGILDALDQVLSKLEVATAIDNGITGTSTGMAELDFMTCGLQPGDLILLAARPSMGKTYPCSTPAIAERNASFAGMNWICDSCWGISYAKEPKRCAQINPVCIAGYQLCGTAENYPKASA